MLFRSIAVSSAHRRDALEVLHLVQAWPLATVQNMASDVPGLTSAIAWKAKLCILPVHFVLVVCWHEMSMA